MFIPGSPCVPVSSSPSVLPAPPIDRIHHGPRPKPYIPSRPSSADACANPREGEEGKRKNGCGRRLASPSSADDCVAVVAVVAVVAIHLARPRPARV